VTGTPRRRPVDGRTTLAAIAVGGMAGALCRYAVGVAWPHPSGAFPWSTLVVNTSGCLLIGVLLVVVLEITQPHPLVRPFLGTGVLGGYTTFSTASVDVQQLMDAGHAALALTYLGATLGAALLATWSGMTAARLADRARRSVRPARHGRSGA